MPRIQDMQNYNFGNFSFTGAKPENLDEPEYTIVCIMTDMTGSVVSFADQLLQMERFVIADAKRSSFNKRIIFRSCRFNAVNRQSATINELYGFTPVGSIEPDTDHPTFSPHGSTPLLDAIYDGILSVLEYSKSVYDADITGVNGLLVVTTDGEENDSRRVRELAAKDGLLRPTFDQLVPYQDKVCAEIKELLTAARRSEKLDSLKVILVGVNTSGVSYNGQKIADLLAELKDKIGIDQYLDAGDVKPGTLGKIAQFISQSVSSTSQALGSGAPSQNINMTF